MKKYLLIVLLLILHIKFYAQNYNFGITGGASYINVHADSGGFSGYPARPVFDINLYYKLTERISFMTGLMYEKKGLSQWIKDENLIHVPSRVSNEGLDLYYLSIPLIFQPSFGKKFRINAELGSYFSYLFNAKLTQIFEYYNINEFRNWESHYEYGFSNVRKDLSPVDLGVLLGLGAELNIYSGLSLGFNYRYSRGFIDLGYNNYNINLSQKSFLLTLKYSFGSRVKGVFDNRSGTDSIKLGRSSVYFELGGNSYDAYSLNYSIAIFTKRIMQLSYNIGYGYIPKSRHYKPSCVLPTALNATIGTRKHYLKSGLGLTYDHAGDAIYPADSNSYAYSEAGSAISLTFRLGYRYQRKVSGIFLKLGATSFFGIASTDGGYIERFFVMPSFGLGYSFR